MIDIEVRLAPVGGQQHLSETPKSNVLCKLGSNNSDLGRMSSTYTSSSFHCVEQAVSNGNLKSGRSKR
jgi:hypothetical protein